MTGLLLFAHGARDPNWARPFQAVADRVRAARPGVPVELAFLDARATWSHAAPLHAAAIY